MSIKKRIRARMVPDIGAVWKHYSTVALGLAGGLQAMWTGLPEDLKARMPEWVTTAVGVLTTFIVVLGLIGKFINQSYAAPKESE